MTLVTVWRTESRLMSAADTRIIRSAGNVLTEHGPKLLPIPIVCKQPGPSGFFDQIAFQTTIGFGYSGATLSALSAHALSSALLGNLAGGAGTPPPSMAEIAHLVAGASAEYMRDVGQLTGNNGLFSARVFGFCHQTRQPRGPASPIAARRVIFPLSMSRQHCCVTIATARQLISAAAGMNHGFQRRQWRRTLRRIHVLAIV